jgi:hypothetical protein
MLQQLPGGLCFAHGPYKDMQCPEWPKCCTDHQHEKWFDLSWRQTKRDDLLNAAALVEKYGLGAMVVELRQQAELAMVEGGS